MSQFNFWNVITITNTSFDDGYMVEFEGTPTEIILVIQSGDKTVEYSFDKVNVHGNLIPNHPRAGVCFYQRPRSKIWFRLTEAGSANVSVEAY